MNFEDLSQFSCAVEFASEENSRAEAADVRAVDVPPPVYPKRNVVMTLAPATDQKIDITITGNCKPFATGFMAKRIPCKSLKRNTHDAYYEKFYVLHDYKVDTEANVDFVLNELISDVLKNVPIALRVEGEYTGKIADFRARLEALPNMYIFG